jgi:hypothetical protein
MNKIIITIMFSMIFVLSSCTNIEDEIKKEIEAAKYCNEDSDCVRIESKCPFGCNQYVNINESSRIQSLIDNFDSKCVYGCMLCEEVECINKTCTEICE